MKAGILTFHKSDNYGAVLQAYALQQKLLSLGIDNELISIAKKTEEAGNTPNVSAGGIASFVNRIKNEQEKRRALFDCFRKERLVCSEEYSFDNLKTLDSDYDLFFVGSDQVWNFHNPDVDARYMCAFASQGKKYSYAASFGQSMEDEIMKKAAPYFDSFDMISVREKTGRELIRKYTGKEAPVLPDPTLLLQKSDWEHLVKQNGESGYVLLYMLVNDFELYNEALKKSEELGVDLKIISGTCVPKFGFDAWSGVSVPDFVTMFANAGFVYTNSFHGTVFSLIFGKNFIVKRLGGELAGRNGRIEELLLRVGCEAALDGQVCCVTSQQYSECLAPWISEAEDYINRAVKNSEKYKMGISANE